MSYVRYLTYLTFFKIQNSSLIFLYFQNSVIPLPLIYTPCSKKLASHNHRFWYCEVWHCNVALKDSGSLECDAVFQMSGALFSRANQFKKNWAAWTLKMEILCSIKNSGTTHRKIQRHNPQDLNLQTLTFIGYNLVFFFYRSRPPRPHRPTPSSSHVKISHMLSCHTFPLGVPIVFFLKHW
jgi:hypothetical protein